MSPSATLCSASYHGGEKSLRRSASLHDSYVVRSGTVRIKEHGFTNWFWKTRFLVLREQTLDIHKSENLPRQRQIPLGKILSIQRVVLKPHCLSLETNSKRYWLSFKNDEDLYSWHDDVYARIGLPMGVSSPANFVHHIHTGFDPVTAGFTGMPEQWGELLTKPTLTKEDYAQDFQDVMDISLPFNFVHHIHVGFDPVTGAFTGMPEEWLKSLNAQPVAKEADEPKAVLETLEFYTNQQKRETLNNATRVVQLVNDPHVQDAAFDSSFLNPPRPAPTPGRGSNTTTEVARAIKGLTEEMTRHNKRVEELLENFIAGQEARDKLKTVDALEEDNGKRGARERRKVEKEREVFEFRWSDCNCNAP